MKECSYWNCTNTFVQGNRGKRFCSRRCAQSYAVSVRRKELKYMAVLYKGGECQICGYNACINALHFHHRDPDEKDFSLSYKGHTYSFEKIKSELDKCDLLCANCHAEEHYDSDMMERVFEAIQRRGIREQHLKNNIKICSECNKPFRGKNKKTCSTKCQKNYKKLPTEIELYECYKKYNGSVVKMAKSFGISDNGLRKRIKKMGIDPSKDGLAEWSMALDC